MNGFGFGDVTDPTLTSLRPHQNPLTAVEHLRQTDADLSTTALQGFSRSTFFIGRQRKEKMKGIDPVITHPFRQLGAIELQPLQRPFALAPIVREMIQQNIF
jgi:hypothetical protein